MAKNKTVCEKCRKKNSEIKPVQVRMDGKAVRYRPTFQRWCGLCRFNHHGHWRWPK